MRMPPSRSSPNDELRLVVLCCHPALDAEVQVALTMRLACGVSTASIAGAFLVPTETMAARLTRAKKRIAESGAGIDLPDDVAVEERIGAVRRTIHLAFTMGHTAGSGETLRDNDLAAISHRMAHTLHDLRPGDPEAVGLLALIELSEARGAGSTHRNDRPARWRAGQQPSAARRHGPHDLGSILDRLRPPPAHRRSG